MSLFADGWQLMSFLGRSLHGMRRVRLRLAGILALAVVAGSSSTGLLAVISDALSRHQFANRRSLLTFIGLCLLLPASRFGSAAWLVRLTGETLRDLRLRLARGFVALPLRRYEELGAHQVLNALTSDITAVTTALYAFPSFCTQLVIVASSLLYLAFLSWQALAVVLLFMAIGVTAYRLPAMAAMRRFRQGRQHLDVMMRHLRAVTDGSKELRLHQPRRSAFFAEGLEPAAQAFSRCSIAGNTILAGAMSFGQVLFFVLVGLILFGLPQLQLGKTGILTGFTLVILYMMAPLDNIMNSLPTLSQAAVAAQAIESMGLTLDAHPEEDALAARQRGAGWRSLELAGVTHAYARDGESGSFVLGPIDLTFEPGQLVFLIGGNGSGKTTLAKLLTGLYSPEAGTIRIDGTAIDEPRRPWYRQHFSAVFSDFYLFDRLLGLGGPDLDVRARQELARLRLDHKVAVADGTLSTLDLSQGQRKRLALLVACLEDRPLYLFDEWAADQDALFKEIFYRELLPALRAKGKTVIVISHDDRYYDEADRIIKLELGQVVHDSLHLAGQAVADGATVGLI